MSEASRDAEVLTIPLTGGAVALVDPADAWATAYRWRCARTKGLRYAMATVERRTVLLHRLLLGAECDGKIVDHINGDGLDNRRANLRATDATTNARNTVCKRRNNTSGVNGVYFQDRDGVWIAQIRMGGRNVHLGQFSTRDAAAVARAMAERDHYGIEPRRAEELNYWLHLGLDPNEFRVKTRRDPFTDRAPVTPSGTCGVSWHVRSQTWRARITVNKTEHYLGSFASKDDAIAARKAAEAVYGFSPQSEAA